MQQDPFQSGRMASPEKAAEQDHVSPHQTESRGAGSKTDAECPKDSSGQDRMQQPGQPYLHAFPQGEYGHPGPHHAYSGYQHPFQSGGPPFPNAFPGFGDTRSGRPGHPKHDQHQYGQIAGLINEFANGNPNLSRVAAYMDGLGNQFWKGALIGAATTLLFTNDQVKTKLSGILRSLMREPTETKESSSREKQ